MIRTRSILIALLTILVFYSGCDEGLTLDPSGFRGTITFSNWPPPDSVWELRLVAFKRQPTDSSGLFAEWLKGNVLVHPPIGTPAFKKFRTDSTNLFVDSIRYSVTLHGIAVDEPETYVYVALAWRYTQNVFTDWRPAGLYLAQPNTFVPRELVIRKHEYVQDVNIHCDFRNPPPKPWQ